MDFDEFDLPYRRRAALTAAETAHREFWAWLREPSRPVAGWFAAWRSAVDSTSPRSGRDARVLETLERAVACLERVGVAGARARGSADSALDRALLAERDFWDALLAPTRTAPDLSAAPLLAELLEVAHGDRAPEALPEDYRELGAALARLRQGFRDPGGPGTAVDLTYFRIWKNGELTVNRSAALVIELLARLRAASEQAVGRALFGIHRFDDLPHRRRLSNLLCEARKLLLPEATLEYRDGMVYALGDWSGVTFWRENRLTEALVEHRQSCPGAERSVITRKGPRARTKPSATDLLEVLRRQREWRREELQAELQLSKTAAIRLLQRLVRERRLAPFGEAKRRRYRVLLA